MSVIGVVQEYRDMGDSWLKAITWTVRDAYGEMVVRLRGQQVDHRSRNAGLGSAMIAHALMRDDAALELLAREHDDPAALAISVAIAARNVLAMTALRPNQSNLFDLTEPYGHALWLAKDAADY